MMIEFDPRAYESLLAEVAESIKAADERFRGTHAGLPVDVIVTDFETHGPKVDLSEATLQEYAEAVSTGAPFKWVLS
ncbi:hypothetical protein [Microbacterium candidum]|uniref:Uncharacterized protein n=1 Tax=Microbacterium candidum TaxID=3041922 RepID=A0ABT7N083_9MICO|nr:hypothetical protein [Microbacterium sp. ASV49]MDL9980070.1 hypothetical protein [Microbacterium sp. ASV49]